MSLWSFRGHCGHVGRGCWLCSGLGAITVDSVDGTGLNSGRKSQPEISALFGPQASGIFLAWPPGLVLGMSHRF